MKINNGFDGGLSVSERAPQDSGTRVYGFKKSSHMPSDKRCLPPSLSPPRPATLLTLLCRPLRGLQRESRGNKGDAARRRGEGERRLREGDFGGGEQTAASQRRSVAQAANGRGAVKVNGPDHKKGSHNGSPFWVSRPGSARPWPPCPSPLPGCRARTGAPALCPGYPPGTPWYSGHGAWRGCAGTWR